MGTGAAFFGGGNKILSPEMQLSMLCATLMKTIKATPKTSKVDDFLSIFQNNLASPQLQEVNKSSLNNMKSDLEKLSAIELAFLIKQNLQNNPGILLSQSIQNKLFASEGNSKEILQQISKEPISKEQQFLLANVSKAMFEMAIKSTSSIPTPEDLAKIAKMFAPTIFPAITLITDPNNAAKQIEKLAPLIVLLWKPPLTKEDSQHSKQGNGKPVEAAPAPAPAAEKRVPTRKAPPPPPPPLTFVERFAAESSGPSRGGSRC